VTPAEVLQHYHQLTSRRYQGLAYFTKPGVRGHGELPAGVGLLLDKAELASKRLVDASGGAGLVGLVAVARGEAERVKVMETSMAALRCAKETLRDSKAMLSAGAIWDAPEASADAICLSLSTDKGNARVEAELLGALRVLEKGGRAYLVMHKDQGAKRYEKLALGLFGELTIVAKRGGWRLSLARKRRESPVAAVSPLRFQAAGFDLKAEPGVYAAGKLDPGTALLLELLGEPELLGKRVLDLGCGYGLLALKASLAGAEVTALDDDLLAVRSAHRNAQAYGADVRCLHSDVDSALQGETFDEIWMNPPFHVGRQVVLDVPHAFLAAAHRRLAPGGSLTLVANRALAYEQILARWGRVETLLDARGFKVLRAWQG
jgi:16S rRNA (guanine1207-N2)-methyltransferase